MDHEKTSKANVKQVVPFFGVKDIQASLRFYIDGLGFVMTNQWINQGKLQWCWLQLGNAAIMLQEFQTEGHNAFYPEGKLGQGVTIYFICEDALSIYRDVVARGLQASLPVVGNGMWVTSLRDPDGYRIDFESPVDLPEETVYSGDEASGEKG